MKSLSAPRALALISILAGVSLLGLGCSDGGTISPASTTTLLPSASSSPGATPTAGPSTGAAPSTLTPSPGTTPVTGPDGKPISDRAILTSLTKKFAADPALLHVKVSVHVKDGVVQLYARVAKQAQKTAIETIAVNEPGVNKVISTIIIDAQINGGPDAPY